MQLVQANNYPYMLVSPENLKLEEGEDLSGCNFRNQ